MDELVSRRACIGNQIFLLLPGLFILASGVAGYCITSKLVYLFNIVLAIVCIVTSCVCVVLSFKIKDCANTLLFTHRFPVIVLPILIILTVFMQKATLPIIIVHCISLFVAIIASISQHAFYKQIVRKYIDKEEIDN